MATKTKKKPTTTVPMTAAEKSARQSLNYATQLSLQQQQSRVRSASRGAFGARTLRHSGTELNRYEVGGFAGDPRTQQPKAGNRNPGGQPTGNVVRPQTHQKVKTTKKRPVQHQPDSYNQKKKQPRKKPPETTRRVGGGRYES